MEGVTLCIRFSANYPITPPYLRIIHPLIVVPCGNIYNNDTQNFNVNLWDGKWTPVNDVFSIVMLIRSTLASTNAYVNFEKSNLQLKKEETKTPEPKPESPEKSVPEIPLALAEYKKLAQERHKKKRTLEEMKVTDVVIKNLEVSQKQRANGLPCAAEVQGKILTYLSLQTLQRVQQVCKLWYRLAWESQVLLDLSQCGIPSPKYLDYVLAKLSLGNVESLNLGITPWRSPLCEPMTRLYQLSHLTWHVSSKPDLDLLKQFTTLRTLDLHTKHYSFFNASTGSSTVLPVVPPLLGPVNGAGSDSDDGEMEEDGDEDKEDQKSDDDELPPDEIADALSLLSNLQNLNLPEVYMVRWRCLSKLPYLTSLQILKSPTLNDKQILYLALCTNLVSLDLSFCEYITSAGVNHLTSLTNLRWLSLSGCVKVQSWTVLGHLPQLNVLKLNRTNLDSDAKALYIPALTTLECLSLADNSSLTHHDINFLATLPQLKVLHLRGCNNLDGDSLAPLTNLHNLTVLTLKACNGLDHIDFVKYLSNLAVLDIAYCRQLKERSVVGLGEMTNLQKLKMSGLLLVPTQIKQSIKEKLKYSVVEF